MAIVIINDAAVAAALSQAPERISAALEPAVKRWMLAQVATLARYPSPPPGSRYRRTGTLGRTWTSATPQWQASSSGFSARLGNSTPYAPYVQGESQARVHVGRWGTVAEAEKEGLPALESEIRAALGQIDAEVNGVAS